MWLKCIIYEVEEETKASNNMIVVNISNAVMPGFDYVIYRNAETSLDRILDKKYLSYKYPVGYSKKDKSRIDTKRFRYGISFEEVIELEQYQ